MSFSLEILDSKALLGNLKVCYILTSLAKSSSLTKAPSLYSFASFSLLILQRAGPLSSFAKPRVISPSQGTVSPNLSWSSGWSEEKSHGYQRENAQVRAARVSSRRWREGNWGDLDPKWPVEGIFESVLEAFRIKTDDHPTLDERTPNSTLQCKCSLCSVRLSCIKRFAWFSWTPIAPFLILDLYFCFSLLGNGHCSPFLLCQTCCYAVIGALLYSTNIF